MKEKEIYDVIINKNLFDGVYYELWLESPVFVDADNEIVRLIAESKNVVCVHILNRDNSSLFIAYQNLDDCVQEQICKQVFK